MTTIKCTHCGTEIEISAALQGQIEQQVLNAEHEKHEAELARTRAEAEHRAKEVAEQAKREAEVDLELMKKRLDAEVEQARKRAGAEQELLVNQLREDAEAAKADAKKFRDQLTELMNQLRTANQARENAELAAQQKLAAEEAKIREAAAREADERQRLNIAAKEKTITDLQRALEDAQRKATQGSQQLQGEILELDLETALAEAFRDDLIEPVAKGTRGGDIAHTVRTPRGTPCGVMIWEFKRTKNWTDTWIPKLKEDVRAAKASLPIIVTEVMPKDVPGDIANYEGVWLCKPEHAIILGTLLRKSLIDVARQRTIDAARTTSAEALYNFITSHEFVQQIEVMVETYRDMNQQVAKERVAFEKLWAQREKQAQRLLLSTAGIIGSMQGQIGASAMPRIKGLELLEAGDDADDSAGEADNSAGDENPPTPGDPPRLL